MKNVKLIALVMAGGKGTRFWPESTQSRPKQYLNLLGPQSLLEETLDRFDGLVERQNRYVVTIKEQMSHAEKASSKINESGLIFEPSGRNTGPCILLSVLSLLAKGHSPDDVVAIVPSDHVILNKEGFKQTLKTAMNLSYAQKKIVTIGITPHFPHTGFGYIEKGELFGLDAFSVSRFKEKPHFELAKEYVSSGNYLWNAGMFVAPLSVLLEEFAKHAPQMSQFAESLKSCLGDEKKLTEVYNNIPSDSIDYAIMEKSDRVLVVPASFDWNDLGSWDALESVIGQTEANTVVSCRDHFMSNAKGNIVFAPGKFVSLINVNDLVIVSNDKTILVIPKKDSQEVKKVVEFLQKKNSLNDLL